MKGAPWLAARRRNAIRQFMIGSVASSHTARGIAENVPETYDVSLSTVRADLRELEHRGMVARTSRGRWYVTRQSGGPFSVPAWLVLAAELRELERRIAEYPHWGACLGAMDARARALRAYFEVHARRPRPATIGGD